MILPVCGSASRVIFYLDPKRITEVQAARPAPATSSLMMAVSFSLGGHTGITYQQHQILPFAVTDTANKRPNARFGKPSIPLLRHRTASDDENSLAIPIMKFWNMRRIPDIFPSWISGKHRLGQTFDMMRRQPKARLQIFPHASGPSQGCRWL